jgi:hypothetical protein
MKPLFVISFIVCLFFITTSAYSGPNHSSACRLDADYTSHSYENIVSDIDIETHAVTYVNDKMYVAVVAQNVSNLDTYQVEIHFDPESLTFIGGHEAIPFSGIDNILTRCGGNIIGFQAVENDPGIITMANALVGNNTSEAPEGSGIIGILGFVVKKQTATDLILKNVFFMDSTGSKDTITKVSGIQLNE